MTESSSNDAPLWKARHFVYAFWVENERPPTVQDAATGLGITTAEARALYEELNARHALLLMPGTSGIRMASPFSGVLTGFRVRVGTKQYYANCAWDSFGIPAALHADARIDAFDAYRQEPLRLLIENGAVRVEPALSGTRMSSAVEGAVVHFLVPFSRWYDDLIFT